MNTKTQTTLRKKLTALRARRGFSLVELLVVIAVIGIIAAIAIPNIAGLTGSAETARDQRNAQNLASVFSAARAAGHDTTYTDKAEAAAAITGATALPVGTASFHVPNLEGQDLTDALGFIEYTSGQMIYNPTP